MVKNNKGEKRKGSTTIMVKNNNGQKEQ